MDANDIKRVNSLWGKVYPYLASQVMDSYRRDSGSVLELGPFSGGISRELARLYPGLNITIADELSGDDSQFDLIIFRGAFFFLNEKKNLLREVFRVLKAGGLAFVGGGYGKGIPQEIIDEIADESRELNEKLGRRWVSIEELEELIRKSGLTDHCQIEEEGGVWLVIRKPIGFRQAFDIHRGEVISLVGGGGKTTLMFALAHELEATGERVVSTTTTKILEPSDSETFLILEPDEEKMLARLISELEEHRHITLATERLPSGKLNGISPEMVTRLAELKSVPYVIVEADGAAQKPIKAPNATEPVISESVSLVVPVVGIDALGCRLAGDNVFRPEIASRLTGLSPGGTISVDTIATLITHPQGIIKGSPAHARIIPLINKVDLVQDLSSAEDVASKILEKGHPQIKRVILGQVQLTEPVVRVVLATGIGT